MRRLVTFAISLADGHTITLYDLSMKLASYLLVSAFVALCVTMPTAALRKVRALLSDDSECEAQTA
ncbi:MAG TPA: hypothetical protein VL282_01195 [Tepidisphaeraceae bacterium]|nr:hypothetical protein [Tepidisphaeraceae bacterium]